MAKIVQYYKIVTPQPTEVTTTDNQYIGDQSVYGSYTWYQRIIQGSATRMSRYREYDFMDSDVDINRSLDIIAQEMTGNNPKGNQPIIIEFFNNKEVDNTTSKTLLSALNQWNRVHKWNTKLFKVSRHLVKYGDCFFIRKDHFSKLEFISAKNVIGAVVSEEDITNVLSWQVKGDVKKPGFTQGTTGSGLFGSGGGEYSEIVPTSKMIRFTTNDDMSDSAPFGESLLKAVFKSFKQKELLEDSVLIYRIQRAPERRVFYIDVGKMPPNLVKQYLEGYKNEIKQKKVPSNFNSSGKQEMDSVLNPMSMQDDYFFAQRPDGRGSKVEVLPGGQNLGEIADLEYFQEKVDKGLRIPVSYTKRGAEGGLFNDGKVGIAYIEELRFALFIEMYQAMIEEVLDTEFKSFLKASGIYIDENMYVLRLPPPSNFGIYRQQEADTALLSSFSTADAIQSLSKRFALKRFLQLKEDEIKENEKMRAEELGIEYDESDPEKSYPEIYGTPAEGEMGAGAPEGLGGEDMFAGGMGIPGEEPEAGAGGETPPAETPAPV